MWVDALSALTLTVSGSTLLLNLATLRTPRGHLPAPAPMVSILVPARNEADNITPCVLSLLAQAYPDFELLVLDDHSTDGTREILAALLEAHTGAPRLRILQGAPLPAGWSGKNWACHQLARAADPAARYLLFTDADTTHAPNALRAAVGEAERDHLALLSLLPAQQVESLAERAIVPLINLQILGYLPLPLMERHPAPALAAANGQYLLFQRAAYGRLGGHTAIAGEIAEDVLLARLAKAHGRIRLANGAALVRCRMYRNAPDIMRGLRRSFSSGFRIDPALSGVLLAANAAAYLLPFLRAPRSPFARLLVGIIILLRLLLAWRTRTPYHAALTHVPGMALVTFSQLLAARDARAGRSAAWKGREYPL